MIRSFAVGSAAVLFLTAGATASPLNLVAGTPDVSAGFISISYNATSHAFSATGFTQNANFPPAIPSLGQRAFSLTCNIDNSGNILPGNQSLTVRGDVNAAGQFVSGANALIFTSSTLSQFGFGATDKFEFVFTAGSGGLWATNNQSLGVIMVGAGLFTSNGGVPRFTSDFSLTSSGNADTFLVPAPGAFALLGAAGLTATRRRRPL